MSLKKNDFIEVEFTGRVKNGEIFDSNIKEDLKKINPKSEAKPFIFSLGNGMFLKGIDDFLIGKPEPSKPESYNINLPAEKAFGDRQPQLVKLIPESVFSQQNLNPVQGVTFNFDGRIGKVLSVSRGRIMVDFNNPIAGKDVVYDIRVLRKITDLNEKVKSFIDFLFRRQFDFEIKENSLILKVEKQMEPFIKLFSEKIKEILGLDLEVKLIEESIKPSKKSQ